MIFECTENDVYIKRLFQKNCSDFPDKNNKIHNNIKETIAVAAIFLSIFFCFIVPQNNEIRVLIERMNSGTAEIDFKTLSSINAIHTSGNFTFY